MKILLLAPHPFYQDRGTPIAVDLLARSLSAMGHDVDLVTYHEGQDRMYEGPGRVRIVRIAAPPGCRGIRPGFSLKKLLADVYLYRRAAALLASQRYDVVHAVEEAAFMARRFKRRFGVPYVFDMDSSMPEQIVEKMPYLRPFLGIMRGFESRALRDAVAVTAVCDALADVARSAGATDITLLRDVPLLSDSVPDGARGFRAELGLDGTVVLYLGNFEAYQGVELLVRSFARLPAGHDAHLVLVGGIPAQIQRLRDLATRLGCSARVHLPGPRPLRDMAALLAEADILVSPRIKGTNTPMKIYSYMAAGKAILATDLFTHTQVLDHETACLAPPEEKAFSAALARLIADPAGRAEMGRRAAHKVKTEYSLEVYQRSLAALYDHVRRAVEAADR